MGALLAELALKSSHDRDNRTGLDLNGVERRGLLRHRASIHGRQLRTYACCPKVRRPGVAILLPLGNRTFLLRHLTLYSGESTND